MYRSDLRTRDKGGAAAVVIAIHAGLLFAFLHLSGAVPLAGSQSVLRVFDITDVPPPPPEPPPPLQREQEKEKPKEKEGAASPKNIRSEATPVVAPKPKIEFPTPPKIAAAEIPRQGTAPTQGASDVRGPGTGAGGTGTGTGSGGAGSGTVGGGTGMAYPPVLLTPRLTRRDYPDNIYRFWPPRGAVFVILRVDPNGLVSDCKIDRSSGVPSIDAETCRLATLKFRFRPALNTEGRPVVGYKGYIQEPTGRMERR
jgi:periplasmic protein TonB